MRQSEDNCFLKRLVQRAFLIPVILSLMVIGGILFYFLRIPDVVLLPDNQLFSCYAYSDNNIGGKSEIIDKIKNDSLIKLDFLLSSELQGPYVGITFTCKDNSTLNLVHYNQVKIQTKGNNLSNLSFAIYSPNQYLELAAKEKDILFSTSFSITENLNQVTLQMKDLNIPDWWLEINNIRDTRKVKPDLRKVSRINISNGYTPHIEGIHSLEIKEVMFSRDNEMLILDLIISELVFILILMAWFTFKYKRSSKNEVITINYIPIAGDLKEKPDDNFISFINSNFQNSELSLDLVSKETGISQRRIANVIQSTFQCNFKTYINRIRINESKRLLIKTELNIGEIAFMVGFNNQSHFNRVFKSDTELSPTEFRESNNQ